MSAHDQDVHVYEGTGIEEGNAPVPKWYIAVFCILVAFFIVYMVRYLHGAQPSTAQIRSSH
jgi:hypothetical protein